MMIMDVEDMLLDLRLEIGILMEGMTEIAKLEEVLMLLRLRLLEIGYHLRQMRIGEILVVHHLLFHHHHRRHIRIPRLLRRCRCRSGIEIVRGRGKERGRGIDRLGIRILRKGIILEVSVYRRS